MGEKKRLKDIELKINHSLDRAVGVRKWRHLTFKITEIKL